MAPVADVLSTHALASQPPLPGQRKRPVSSRLDGDLAWRPCRDCGPKWNVQEMLALVDAKCEEYLDEFKRRFQIQPLHVRDLRNLGDKTFVVDNDASNEDVAVVDETIGDDFLDTLHGLDAGTPVFDNRVCNSTPQQGISPTFGLGTATVHHSIGSPILGGRQPEGRRMSLVILSSSEFGGSSAQRYPCSIGVRRRTSSAHAALAEATKAIGEVMVAQMKEMVGVTRKTESNRLDVQLKLFAEKMQYQREKDHHLYEQDLLASQKTCLAIAKQGELVQCLTEISTVLSVGLMVSRDHDVHYRSEAPPITTKDPQHGCRQGGRWNGDISTLARGYNRRYRASAFDLAKSNRKPTVSTTCRREMK
jgi:hypothetical protein